MALNALLMPYFVLMCR